MPTRAHDIDEMAQYDNFIRLNSSQHWPGLCIEAARRNPRSISHCQRLHTITPRLCEELVCSGTSLEHIPPGLITKKLAQIAVARNGRELEYVPRIGANAYYIPDGCIFLEEEIYISAMRQNGLALRFVPKSRITESICLEAVRQAPKAIQFIYPTTWSTCNETSYSYGVYTNARVIQSRDDLPCRLCQCLDCSVNREKYEKLCYVAVKQNIHAIAYICHPTLDICIEIAKRSSTWLLWLPRLQNTNERVLRVAYDTWTSTGSGPLLSVLAMNHNRRTYRRILFPKLHDVLLALTAVGLSPLLRVEVANIVLALYQTPPDIILWGDLWKMVEVTNKRGGTSRRHH